jgi:hypothetical protein
MHILFAFPWLYDIVAYPKHANDKRVNRKAFEG